MKILAIETSFDEAGLAIIEYEQKGTTTSIEVLSDTLFSQAEAHEEYGGVYPTLAKQIHAKNLVPLLTQTLEEANLHITTETTEVTSDSLLKIQTVLEREPEMFAELSGLLVHIRKPDIDAIAITHGPGLEPALWVGISFAKALSIAWDIPLTPVNHMEGHVAAALAISNTNKEFVIQEPQLPALALLISGAHTELILIKKWLDYEKIGSTRDDAIGEAYDKAARLLGFPYPGGPKISKLAQEARGENLLQPYSLPRPMLTTNDFDFSFSGLKTAVRNIVQSIEAPTDEQKKQIAREFDDAATEVLVAKTKSAIEEHAVQTLIVSGGVAASKYIRENLENLTKEYADMRFYVPTLDLATDNGRMIAFAAAIHDSPATPAEEILANGNLSIESESPR
ncbi:MAG: tRNA (adenosine(37)-N6)-threonylcarbamoyltransferase complex transferase subunit TsaD [Candidatus Pacebacteria bacterium]|nr:tRNA (adenosine(37)-N6)-threonylcarbamoyltransferase complex transferase subunit TsaD [Candidatus Paceibacterota bacterium]